MYLWSLVEGDTQEGADVLSADLRSTLKDYSDEVRLQGLAIYCLRLWALFTEVRADAQVQLLRWDKAGRYLVTADGSEATIW